MTHRLDDETPNFSIRKVIKAIVEYRGRRRPVLPPEFQENEIVTGPYPLGTRFLGAVYVPAFPNLEAVVVFNNGERRLSSGGYIRLPRGKYKIYYVDRHEQYRVLPDVKAITSDGAEVAITCGLTFTVNDSLAVQNVRNPLEALFKTCEAVLRQIVRTHRHDEIIDERPDDGELNPAADARGVEMISNDQISAAVQHQVGLSEACRAFTLHHVTILNRQGYQRLLDIREDEVTQLRAGRQAIRRIEQKIAITKKQKALMVQQGSLSAQQALNERTRRELLYTAEKIMIELERLRKLPGYKHQERMRNIDSRIEALKTLMQAQAMPGAVRNTDELRLFVASLVAEIPDLNGEARAGKSAASEAGLDDDDEDDFIELLIPKKKR